MVHNSGLRCLSLSESAVPPDGDKTREIIAFEDVDVRDRAWGNITVNIKIMAPNGGRLFFNVTNPRILFLQRTDEEDMSITTLQGSIDNINSVMPYLRWDADLSYTGYAPLLISIMDHQNSGGPSLSLSLSLSLTHTHTHTPHLVVMFDLSFESEDSILMPSRHLCVCNRPLLP
jgi:hypothetical protein